LVLLGELQHVVEAPRHDVVEPFVDGGFGPEIAAAILYPFEIGHRYAAGVGEDVRDDEDALLLEDRVRTGRGRTVRALANDLRAHLPGVTARDDVLERRRGGHVHVERKQISIRERLAPREALERANRANVLDRRFDVDAVRVVITAGAVADRGDLAA